MNAKEFSHHQTALLRRDKGRSRGNGGAGGTGGSERTGAAGGPSTLSSTAELPGLLEQGAAPKLHHGSCKPACGGAGDGQGESQQTATREPFPGLTQPPHKEVSMPKHNALPCPSWPTSPTPGCLEDPASLPHTPSESQHSFSEREFSSLLSGCSNVEHQLKRSD